MNETQMAGRSQIVKISTQDVVKLIGFSNRIRHEPGVMVIYSGESYPFMLIIPDDDLKKEFENRVFTLELEIQPTKETKKIEGQVSPSQAFNIMFKVDRPGYVILKLRSGDDLEVKTMFRLEMKPQPDVIVID